MQINSDSFLIPNWPAPNHVRAYATTRLGGHSVASYNSFNLSYEVGDDPAAVTANRNYLTNTLDLPTTPLWLRQKHGPVVVSADADYAVPPEADASFATRVNRVCLVATADCLPLLVCNKIGSQVAAIHAGWRGLAAGIIEQTLQHFSVPSTQLFVWLGPAIGPGVFEVGEEVRQTYIQHYADDATFFQASSQGKWLADLYGLARRRLNTLGITDIYGGGHCTYSENDRFFSYRRDGQYSGRMVSLIWLADHD